MPRKKDEEQIIGDEMENVESQEMTQDISHDIFTESTDDFLLNEVEKKTEALIPEESQAISEEPEDGPDTSMTEDTAISLPSGGNDIFSIDRRRSIQALDDLEFQEALAWQDLRNAYNTRRIITATLEGAERIELKTIAIAYYKGFRIAIPLKEMMIDLEEDYAYGDMVTRQSRILNSMLGSEITLVIKGIDKQTRSVVASRREAMMRRRRIFLQDESGLRRIQVGSIVEARVIAVSERSIRIDAFGVEMFIPGKDIDWLWVSDVREMYAIGDKVAVKIKDIQNNTSEEELEHLTVRADIKSLRDDPREANLRKCAVQSSYIGTVANITDGSIYVRLNVGVNGRVHTCLADRMPGRGDIVNYVMTDKNYDLLSATGIVTRVLKTKI